MKKFKLGQKVIVNTGGNDTVSHIDMPLKNIHGFYWKEQDSYLCRFTDNPDKLLCNGAKSREDCIKDNLTGHPVFVNSQYIPSIYIREFATDKTPTNATT